MNKNQQWDVVAIERSGETVLGIRLVGCSTERAALAEEHEGDLSLFEEKHKYIHVLIDETIEWGIQPSTASPKDVQEGVRQDVWSWGYKSVRDQRFVEVLSGLSHQNALQLHVQSIEMMSSSVGRGLNKERSSRHVRSSISPMSLGLLQHRWAWTMAGLGLACVVMYALLTGSEKLPSAPVNQQQESLDEKTNPPVDRPSVAPPVFRFSAPKSQGDVFIETFQQDESDEKSSSDLAPNSEVRSQENAK